MSIALTLFMRVQCHAQKVTVDPNAGDRSEGRRRAQTDTRLAQKVTYEAWHTPVKTILADISKSTGVTLNAGFSKMDWQVRDRRMNVYVKDVTLAQLMNSICPRDEVQVVPRHGQELADLPIGRRPQAPREASKGIERTRGRAKERGNPAEDRTCGLAGKGCQGVRADLETLKRTSPYLGLSAVQGFAKMLTQMFAEQPKLKEMFIRGDRMAVRRKRVLSFNAEACRGRPTLRH